MGAPRAAPTPGAFPPAPRSRLLTLLGPSTVHLFHAGSGGGESGAVRPGLVGGEVTSSFSISRAGLTSLMERQSLGMEAGGDGGRAGRGPRQTQTHTRMHTCAHAHMCAHTDIHAHVQTHIHEHRCTQLLSGGKGEEAGGSEGAGLGWGPRHLEGLPCPLPDLLGGSAHGARPTADPGGQAWWACTCL